MTPKPNPYTAQPIQPQPQYQQYKDNFTNPYYANKGQNNYFGNWSNNNSQRWLVDNIDANIFLLILHIG